MGTIYERLRDYSQSDYYGFHMPGHKRNFTGDVLPYGIDITEIEGFDDLHHAEGMLMDAQNRAARVYGADETHFLVNGSTVGILSAILGVTNKGDRILVARNCHKSVYHAIYMNELNPVYLYPGFHEDTQLNTEISVSDVKEALEEYPQTRAVVIVSPTYDGVVSDVAEIARAVHAKGLPLIVDEAHGAHFGFHPYFPENANIHGADIVIHSVHKTLPSLTQTALLHINGNLVNRERVRRYLHMLQSSSPSYVLMASIDSCVDMLDTRREELFFPYIEMLKETREKLKELKRLRMLEETRFDRSKIVISAKDTDMNGKELYELLLEKYHLQMEMMAGTYVLAMTSVGDTKEGMDRLVHAVMEIDEETDVRMEAAERRGDTGKICKSRMNLTGLPRLSQVYTSAELEHVQKQAEGRVLSVPYGESAGHISLEYAYLYPPGIPIVVPGERITAEVAKLLLRYNEAGYSIEGQKKQGQIEVWTYGKDILYNG